MEPAYRDPWAGPPLRRGWMFQKRVARTRRPAAAQNGRSKGACKVVAAALDVSSALTARAAAQNGGAERAPQVAPAARLAVLAPAGARADIRRVDAVPGRVEAGDAAPLGRGLAGGLAGSLAAERRQSGRWLAQHTTQQCLRRTTAVQARRRRAGPTHLPQVRHGVVCVASSARSYRRSTCRAQT